MNSNKLKQITSVIFCLIFILASFVGCSMFSEEETTTTATTTTTTTTKPTTTEDLETTFKESSTRKIYTALSKDESGSYPYEIAKYTTTYQTSNKTRTTNLKNAVEKINNIKIPKGEIFSFNQVVGKRTVTAGYETATVYENGEATDGLGGGICQVSSTIFQCILRANCKIVERTYHSLTIGYVPLGGDATVQWNSKDFKFENNLGCDVKLKITCSGGKLTCTLYAKKDVDPGNVKIKISKSGEQYILTRTVNGKQNYRTVSKYKTPKDE